MAGPRIKSGGVPAIHGFFVQQGQRTWMPATSPGMTMCKKTAVGGVAHRPDCVGINLRNRTLDVFALSLFGAADRLDLGVGEFFHGKRLTVPPLEALVLVDRENHEPVLPFRVIASGAFSASS